MGGFAVLRFLASHDMTSLAVDAVLAMRRPQSFLQRW